MAFDHCLKIAAAIAILVTEVAMICPSVAGIPYFGLWFACNLFQIAS
jgi:hypothetical protein